MKLQKNHKILIVGLGLLGGSYAISLAKQGYTVTAITRSQSSIDYAMEQGMIARGAAFVDPALVGEADLVVFALYPHVFKEWIKENQHLFKSGAVITDVTGVKSCIVDDIQTMLRPDVEFIAAHPMAGREQSGVQYADDSIFRGANYVVTPSERNTPEAIELCEDLGRVLGFARISRLAPKEHDEIIAFVSQLTHCIAVALMTCTPAGGEHTNRLEEYTGDSFRDLTRIARLNDEMWSELFQLNKYALLHQMTVFEGELNRMRSMLELDDMEGLRAMMQKSTARRALFDKKL
ncbi:MAG: prephenate dehydrogenase [Clostridia bacterium]|nr:prephenate dehydrogenase [Clostridia bacterium]